MTAPSVYRGPVAAQDLLVGDVILGIAASLSSRVVAVQVGPKLVRVRVESASGSPGEGIHELREQIWIQRCPADERS